MPLTKKFNTSYLYLFLAFLVVGFTLVQIERFDIINIIIILICLYSYSQAPYFLIFLTIVLLPTNGIYGTEYNFLGMFSPLTTTQFFSVLYLFNNYKRLYKQKTNIVFTKEFFSIRKIAISIILSIAIYMIYSDLKNGIMNIYDVDSFLAFKRLIKSILRFGFIILLIKLIHNIKIKSIIEFSISVGIVFLITSALLSEQLINYNLMAVNANEELESGVIFRFSGFFGWGDVNSLGGLLSIYLAFLAIKLKYTKNNLNQYLMMVFVLIGIVFTGSRTAITSIAVVLAIALLIERKLTFSLKNYIIGGIVMLILLSIPIIRNSIELIIDRFQYAESELDIKHSGSRIAKWLMYYQFMTEYQYIFVIGTYQEYWLNMGDGFVQRRVPHNLYIWMLFQAGIIPVYMIINSLIKLTKNSFKTRDFLYVIIPFIFISSYVSEFGYAFYFVLILPLILIYKYEYNSSNNPALS